MKTKLWVDVESFSDKDLIKGGVYKYTDTENFEIMLLAWAVNDEPTTILDLKKEYKIPERLLKLLRDKDVEIYARNAQFERIVFIADLLDVPRERFVCTATIMAQNGLPLSLEASGKALKLSSDKAKDARGKALIKHFCVPCKPTKANGMKTRNLPEEFPEMWEEFKEYCIQDVEADRNTYNMVKHIINEKERAMYVLDQKINDRGVELDMKLVDNAVLFDAKYKEEIIDRMINITGLNNPNSRKQLIEWLETELDENIETLRKEDVKHLLAENTDDKIITEVLQLRQQASKTSVSKYKAMQNCVCESGRAHGLFYFLGAYRTGRWAGRLIQLQNLPKNEIKDLDDMREILLRGDYASFKDRYDNVSDILSQLIRTALVAPEYHTFAVSDYKAIEARVIAWLASEEWRNEVFATHGMIYEASASKMFNVPIESIRYIDADGNQVDGPNIHLRANGKVAELALGYGGGWKALDKMGGAKMGLTQDDMENLKVMFRRENPNIVDLWKNLEKCAIHAVKFPNKTITSKYRGLKFRYQEGALRIMLPSGRMLSYWGATLGLGKFGNECVKYYSQNDKKQWVLTDTYGGKLVENVVQAIARDCLVEAMLRLDEEHYDIVMHVHDEIVIEVEEEWQDQALFDIERIMGLPIPWADGLLLPADGYVTKYYKKD